MGHRITRAASHLSVDEVKERMNTDGRAFVRRHWWIIYNALVAPRNAEEIVTVAQIQHAFEESVGHEVDDSTIYRLLHRHGWRKLMPRPRHSKADPQI